MNMVTNPLEALTSSMDEVIPRLFLGDKNAAVDLDLIAKLKISHIIMAELIPLPRIVTSSFPNLAMLHVPIADMAGKK